MISKIIVGVDFSDASRIALAKGKLWAETLGVPLVAMHVVHVPTFFLEEAYPLISEPGWAKSMAETASTHLSAWVQGISGASVYIVSGSPAEELVAAADPDTLLIVGQVGYSAIEHLLFGSTAARVVRHAPCDVLVVRQTSRTPGTGPAPTLTSPRSACTTSAIRWPRTGSHPDGTVKNLQGAMGWATAE